MGREVSIVENYSLPGIAQPVSSLMHLIGAFSGAVAAVRRTDTVVNTTSVRLMHIQTPLDHGKATRELGWMPRPTEESIRAGVRWFNRTR